MSVRHKFESTATGTGSPITVSTPSGYSNDITTVRPVTMASYGGFARLYSYVILDANGTDWEHGYGRVSGTNFYRHEIIESTNAGSAINLSGAGTHTILVPEQALTAIKAPLIVTGSLTTSTGGNVSFSGVSTNNDGITEFPGYTAPASFPGTGLDLNSVIKFAKSYKITAYVTANGAEDTTATCVIKGDGNYWDWIVANTMPVANGANTYATFSSPAIDVNCPFSTSTNVGIFPGSIYFYISHGGALSCDYDVDLYVDYYF